jgi:uncharacterized alpha/beta hydrolase family protein
MNMFFNQKKYREEVEPKRWSQKMPSRRRMITIGLMASFPPTRLILKAHGKRLLNEAVIEPSQVEQEPILYLHGFRGGGYTTERMVASALAAKGSRKFLKVTADLWGNVKLTGTWTSDRHPLVQVVFKYRIVGTKGICYYLRWLLPLLSSALHFKKYDVAAHSLGAPCIVKTAMQMAHRRNFPQLDRCAMIAGPFDGVMYLGDIPNLNQFDINGRPWLMSPSYLYFLRHRKRVRQASFLNIYGNILDETNSDKFISVVSARSIRYVLAPVVKSFQEVEISGPGAEHSDMHDSPFVNHLINQFFGLS